MNTFALVVLATLTGGSTVPTIADVPHTRVRLVAREDAAVAGKPVDVAIVLESDEGWHTYWKNPGDAGMATTVAWTLPAGWKAGELAWPAPAKFQEGTVATYGYSGTVWLLSAIDAGKAAATKSVTLAAHVEWLECREICLPGSADVTLTLPVKSSAKESQGPAFERARARIPADAAGWKVGASWTAKKTLMLAFAPAVGTVLDDETAFFPEQAGIVEPSAPAKLTAGAKGGYSLELTPARMAVGAPPMLDGVLVSGGRAWHVRVPLPPREI